jgi:MFS family permease
VAVRGAGRSLLASLHALRAVFSSPDLRRVELAFGGFYAAEWAFLVALGVYAYDAGGVYAVGLVGFIRTFPVAFAVPFGALVADRYRRERVLLAVHATRALLLGLVTVSFYAAASPPVVYLLAALAALVSTALRPTQWALMPSLARTPQELTATNAASSLLEGLAVLAGPAIGGLILAAGSEGPVFALSAGLALWAAVLVGRVNVSSAREPAGVGATRHIVEETLAGTRALKELPDARLLISLFTAQSFVRGLLNVLIVVSALGLLGMGASGVGFLNAAFGVGGLVGATAALMLVGRRELGGAFGLALVMWGLPIALIAIWTEPAAALLFLALVGAGNSVLDVSGLTLLQRIIPDDVLARVFGVLEALVIAVSGLGAILTPLLIDGLGVRGALVATGAILPVIAVVSWRRLVEIDRGAPPPAPGLELLRAIPMFAPLPPATIERLASNLALLNFPAGAVVIREGEVGDRFYVVEDGELEIRRDGVFQLTRTRGDYFGEIALLRDVPRTATVTALTDVALYALERDVFISAVTGHRLSVERAEAIVTERLPPAGTTAA